MSCDSRSSLKRRYPDKEHSLSPAAKQIKAEDTQRGETREQASERRITSAHTETLHFAWKFSLDCLTIGCFISLCAFLDLAGLTGEHCMTLCVSVLLYVRSESEEVFDALMLNTPTLIGLREAVSNTHTHSTAWPAL